MVSKRHRERAAGVQVLILTVLLALATFGSGWLAGVAGDAQSHAVDAAFDAEQAYLGRLYQLATAPAPSPSPRSAPDVLKKALTPGSVFGLYPRSLPSLESADGWRSVRDFYDRLASAVLWLETFLQAAIAATAASVVLSGPWDRRLLITGRFVAIVGFVVGALAWLASFTQVA